MQKIIHLIFAIAKSLGFDLYGFTRKLAERSMWRKARPLRHTDDGVCVAVDITSFDSLAQVGRDFIDTIRQTSIPFSVFNRRTRFSSASRFSDEDMSGYLSVASSLIDQRNVISIANYPIALDRHFHNTITPFWEFESGLPEVNPELLTTGDDFIVFSDFCKKYIDSIVPSGKRVFKVRYPFPGKWTAKASRENVRSRYGISQKVFAVFFHFNLGSGCNRKNPEGALKAFQQAFTDIGDAHLVLKVAGLPPDSAEYRNLNEIVKPLGDRVTLISERLSRQEILDLLSASDAYMSLHRGEGFGIGMLEAMSVGTPVICTNYGGNTEFCTPETAFLVDYEMVPNTSGEKFFVAVKEWPDPDVDQATKYLHALYANRELGKAKAAAATKFINEYFSVANFESDLRKYLAANCEH